VPSQEGPIGRSAAIKQLREQIKKLAPLDAPVLIEGEAGSGKKLAAYALHRTSPERGKPFDSNVVSINYKREGEIA
jgi:DNA-binding NtrC family response regulator